jgi:PAS domain S-box-containing protein
MEWIFFICGLLFTLTIYLWVRLRKSISVLKMLESVYQRETINRNNQHCEEKKGLLNLIRKSEEMAIVTRQTQNAVMLMDASGNIIWVNDSFTRLYEYTYEEFIKALGSNIRQTSFNPLIHERLNRCVNEREPVTYEALNITKFGKEIWTHTSLVPLLDENNEVVGMVTIDSDIHTRIKASEDMAKFIFSFHQKMEYLSDQLNILVELTNTLFERIEISQQRMNRTEEIVAYNKEISDKMKILGINASIEAHVSGFKGSGFRVIANEVVTISNNMTFSLKEISDLVGSVKRASDKLGTERERSENAINKYRELMNELDKEIRDAEFVVRKIK